MVSIPFLLILVIAIASFAPHPIRGGVILLCCGLGIWYSLTHYSPWSPTPELPEDADPAVDAAETLKEKYSVEQTPKIQKIEK